MAAARQVPTLGVCFGHQVIATALAGRQAVRWSAEPEIGWDDIDVLDEEPILRGLAPGFRTFLSHHEEVAPGTPGLRTLARSRRCEVQALAVEGAPLYGVQFHAEMAGPEARALVSSHAERHPRAGPGRPRGARPRDRLRRHRRPHHPELSATGGRRRLNHRLSQPHP